MQNLIKDDAKHKNLKTTEEANTSLKNTSDMETNDKELEELFKSEDIKKQILKNVLLGVIGLLCFAVFMYYSEAWIAIAGVVTVISVAYLSETSIRGEILPCRGKSVLITGCDTGFGNLLARHLAQRGVTVFAGCYNQSCEGAKSLTNELSARLHVLQMDVTNDRQVKECVEYVKKISDGRGLWGLVNNAGLNFLGDIELTTMSQFQRVTDINMLGVVRVTKAFLPLIRKQRGRIVNVSSVKGRLSMPFNAAYCMSKYAIESFSDVLRMECKKFGVDVSVIEPGNFGGATGCLDMARIRSDFVCMWEELSDEGRDLYGKDYIDLHLRACESAIPTACFDLSRVIQSQEHALFSEKPRSRYLIAGSSGRVDIYKWRVWLNPLLPTWLMDRWLLSDISTFKPVHLTS